MYKDGQDDFESDQFDYEPNDIDNYDYLINDFDADEKYAWLDN